MLDRTSTTLLDAWRTYCGFMRRLGVEPAALQSDAGPEYVSREAFDFCDKHAVNRILSVRYTPQQNGVAESVFRVYVPRARAVLHASGLPKRVYALAFQHAIWVRNRTYSRSLGGRPVDRLPHPHYADIHLARVFGCRVWARQPDVHVGDKMDPVARAGVHVGMSEVF